MVAGRPGLDRLEPFGRFEDWSNLVRGALVWLGEPDPCYTRAFIAGDDPERTALGTLLQAMYDNLEGWATVGKMSDAANDAPMGRYRKRLRCRRATGDKQGSQRLPNSPHRGNRQRTATGAHNGQEGKAVRLSGMQERVTWQVSAGVGGCVYGPLSNFGNSLMIKISNSQFRMIWPENIPVDTRHTRNTSHGPRT